MTRQDRDADDVSSCWSTTSRASSSATRAILERPRRERSSRPAPPAKRSSICCATSSRSCSMDVCMPELDGFELAAMIRDHPRFQRTAIIFVSGVHLTDLDRLRGYEYGAVDYLPVPVVPEILRAKVSVFVELYRKTRELERLNARARAAGRGRGPARARRQRRASGRTSSWPCWRTSCGTRWRRSARPRTSSLHCNELCADVGRSSRCAASSSARSRISRG